MPSAQQIGRAVGSPSHAHTSEYHANDFQDFSAHILRWYDAQKSSRNMPWRRERSDVRTEERQQHAYEVWVSETMCQQTQVATVIPYYERWIKTFPTLASLAKGDLEVVRQLWAGLGYYSRASRLHAGAQKVVDDFDGVIPDDHKALEKEVPGIGPYTAAAICSIAFGKRIAAVDGNVQRVISRVFALHAPIQAKATLNAIAELAAEVMPASRPGEHNQAIMDLGYSVCSPKAPKCASCPLASQCLAFAEINALKRNPKRREEDIENEACELCTPFDPAFELKEEGVMLYPIKKIRKVLREEETAVRVVETADHQVLVVQRPEKGLLAGQWEFPAVDLPVEDEPSTIQARRDAMRTRLKELLGKIPDGQSLVDRPIVRHTFSHMIRHYIADSVAIDAVLTVKEKRAKWITRAEMEHLHLGKAMRLVWNDYVADARRSDGKPKKRPADPKPKQIKKARVEEAAPITRFLVKKPVSERQEVVEETASSSPRKKRVILVSDEED